jgi:hypothetical protein
MSAYLILKESKGTNYVWFYDIGNKYKINIGKNNNTYINTILDINEVDIKQLPNYLINTGKYKLYYVDPSKKIKTKRKLIDSQ